MAAQREQQSRSDLQRPDPKEPVATSDREIVVHRLLDAPRALVFKMFMDPAHLAHWWGPEGYTLTTYTMDARPGGAWRFVMHGPDGRDYQNRIVFREIVPHERIVYDHDGDAECEPPKFQVTITLGDVRGKTDLTVRAVFPSPQALAYVVKTYKADEGSRQTYARLGALAEAAAKGQGAAGADPTGLEFVISRTFDAPRDLVFAAWTEEKHLAKWFGPRGTEVVKSRLDFRVGGTYHYALKSGDGSLMWGLWNFQEIVKPSRLVIVSGFADEHGSYARHPMAPLWPLRKLATVEFTEHKGRTTVLLRWMPLDDATDAERAAFLAGHAGMHAGWGGTYEKLAAYLVAETPKAG